MCGPTVYDKAHMGHARTYVSFDIIRRILRDYYNHSITLAMNITDIDDKIICRANEMNIAAAELASKNEKEFFADMEALGVEPPTILTRVSEYVDDIVQFVTRLIDNGYAYVSNGSVYFDITSYEYKGFVYGQLRAHEVVSDDEMTNPEKRSQSDFALWKTARPGEPSWPSPWGNGRPGWHIECSAMAASSLGRMNSDGSIDIHSGGIDLCFPHHENEVAQSQAYYGNPETPWIRKFLHSGHLHIEGRKMSKSLKNFISIRDVVLEYGARAVRILFLSHKYNTSMTYNEESMKSALATDTMLSSFLARVDNAIRKASLMRWNEQEFILHSDLIKTENHVASAFADNFNTPEMLVALANLMHHTTKYMETGANKTLLTSIQSFVTRILKIVGLEYSTCASVSESNGSLLTALIDFRTMAKKAIVREDKVTFFAESDKLRDEILPKLGFIIEDTKDGSIVRSV